MNNKNYVKPIGIVEFFPKNNQQMSYKNSKGCVWQHAGAEAAVHAARDIFTGKESEAVLLVDISITFTTLKRQTMNHKINILCPTLVTYVKTHMKKLQHLLSTEIQSCDLKRN